MSFVTVGIDTDRVYNRKNPPGGKCTNLFGGDEEIITNSRNQSRMRSNVDVDSEDTRQTQARTQKRSQPSVCPLTGETIGHNPVSTSEEKPSTASKDISPEYNDTTNEEATSALETPAPVLDTDPDTKEVPSPDQAPDSTPEDVPTDDSSTPPPSVIVETTSPTSEEEKSANTPVSDTRSTSNSSTLNSTSISNSTSNFAPVAQRNKRNPPGGHSTGFW